MARSARWRSMPTGSLAAATSTGGYTGKLPGRVGDSPIIGAGTYADDLCAVSGTGLGEAFIRTVLAYDVAARLRYKKRKPFTGDRRGARTDCSRSAPTAA